jgi:TolB protein
MAVSKDIWKLLVRHVITGLGVTSALVANVAAQAPIAQPSSPSPVSTNLRSRISVYDLRDHSVHVLYTADVLFEAPNWSKDGKYLLANSKGALYRLNLQSDGTASPQKVSLDPAYVCNNDKAISPDGKLLAFSVKKPGSAGSQVFVAEQDGSHVRLLVPETPSYFHGWSPDVRWLAFVAKRVSKDSDVIQTIFGGQGTINVNSWSPDSTRIAFVSYEPLS